MMQHTAHHHAHLDGRPPAGGFAHPHKNAAILGIESGMVVADFGAGSGAYTLAIAKLLQGNGRVYAIDVQRDLLRRIHNEAQQRGLADVHVLWGDLEKEQGSKLAEHSVDFVLVSNLLFQLADKAAPLREAWRILRPRGKLALIDWSESFGGMGPIKSHVVDKESALHLAARAGFELVREFPAGAHHYGLICKPVPRA